MGENSTYNTFGYRRNSGTREAILSYTVILERLFRKYKLLYTYLYRPRKGI